MIVAFDSSQVIVAGFAAAIAESLVNCFVAWDQGIKKGSTEDIISSVSDCLVKGGLYAVTGAIASRVLPTTLEARDTVEFLTQGAEMIKTWGQNIYQSLLPMPGNVVNTISSKYLAPKKAIKSASRKTRSSVRKRSSNRRSQPVALVA